MQTYPACKELLVSIKFIKHDKCISNHISVNFLSGVWKGYEIYTALVLTVHHDKLHYTFVMSCLNFREKIAGKIDLDISYESSTSGQAYEISSHI